MKDFLLNHKIAALLAVVILTIATAVTIFSLQSRKQLKSGATTNPVSLSFSPASSSFAVGDTPTVAMMIDTAGNDVSGADITISFSQNTMDLVSFTPASPYSAVINGPVQNGTYRIVLVNATTAPVTGQAVSLGTFSLRATHQGAGTLSFGTIQITGAGVSSYLQVASQVGGVYTITNGGTGTGTSTGTATQTGTATSTGTSTPTASPPPGSFHIVGRLTNQSGIGGVYTGTDPVHVSVDGADATVQGAGTSSMFYYKFDLGAGSHTVTFTPPTGYSTVGASSYTFSFAADGSCNAGTTAGTCGGAGNGTITDVNFVFAQGGTGTATSTQTATQTGTATATTSLPPTTSGNLVLNFTLALQAIGNIGTNSSPVGGNTNPVTTTRPITVELFDQSGSQVGTDGVGTITYSAATKLFTGSVSMTAVAGNYVIKVQSPRYLRKRVAGFQTLADGTNVIPQTTLIVGDVNGDNKLDILDYNVISDCYNTKSTSAGCLAHPEHANADLNDDGKVDGVDYNIFISNLSVQNGD